jgi:hypothetical protein
VLAAATVGRRWLALDGAGVATPDPARNGDAPPVEPFTRAPGADLEPTGEPRA